MQALLDVGADVNAQRHVSPDACSRKATEIVNALLAKGAGVNAQANNGMTALIWAAQEGHTKIVQAFLDKGWRSMLKQSMAGQP